jgi:CubicO group peptidase (beta-lactamase class C family)
MIPLLMPRLKALVLIALGLVIAAMGIYVASADDAPGAALMGVLVLAAAVLLGIRLAQNRLSKWAGRAALFVAVLATGFSALLTREVKAAAPLFTQAADVPFVSAPVSSPQWASAAERARPMLRDAIVAQNLPGVSVAVGAGDTVVWAEGLGWRDLWTNTPMTPGTRFNIGTAARTVSGASLESLGMRNTGTDAAFAWSPEAIGEPGEDFPGFTMIRHLILQPLGIAAPEYPLPGDRATFYVPATHWKADSTDPRTGHRLMFMRDLACCADGKTFYSTPSDLVRFALAAQPGNVNGELAGGNVVSIVTRPNQGLAVVVASNIAYADTPGLALKVADVFAEAK